VPRRSYPTLSSVEETAKVQMVSRRGTCRRPGMVGWGEVVVIPPRREPIRPGGIGAPTGSPHWFKRGGVEEIEALRSVVGVEPDLHRLVIALRNHMVNLMRPGGSIGRPPAAPTMRR
jgi:hypothetical protein